MADKLRNESEQTPELEGKLKVPVFCFRGRYDIIEKAILFIKRTFAVIEMMEDLPGLEMPMNI
ncbi:hypothetical protein [Enterocloster citroniae]